MGVFSGFQEYLKEIQWESQGSFKCVSTKSKGCSKKVFKVLQGSLKGLQERFKGVSVEFLIVFKSV